jgi:hypothetical protein
METAERKLDMERAAMGGGGGAGGGGRESGSASADGGDSEASSTAALRVSAAVSGAPLSADDAAAVAGAKLKLGLFQKDYAPSDAAIRRMLVEDGLRLFARPSASDSADGAGGAGGGAAGGSSGLAGFKPLQLSCGATFGAAKGGAGGGSGSSQPLTGLEESTQLEWIGAGAVTASVLSHGIAAEASAGEGAAGRGGGGGAGAAGASSGPLSAHGGAAAQSLADMHAFVAAAEEAAARKVSVQPEIASEGSAANSAATRGSGSSDLLSTFRTWSDRDAAAAAAAEARKQRQREEEQRAAAVAAAAAGAAAAASSSDAALARDSDGGGSADADTSAMQVDGAAGSGTEDASGAAGPAPASGQVQQQQAKQPVQPLSASEALKRMQLQTAADEWRRRFQSIKDAERARQEAEEASRGRGLRNKGGRVYYGEFQGSVRAAARVGSGTSATKSPGAGPAAVAAAAGGGAGSGATGASSSIEVSAIEGSAGGGSSTSIDSASAGSGHSSSDDSASAGSGRSSSDDLASVDLGSSDDDAAGALRPGAVKRLRIDGGSARAAGRTSTTGAAAGSTTAAGTGGPAAALIVPMAAARGSVAALAVGAAAAGAAAALAADTGAPAGPAAASAAPELYLNAWGYPDGTLAVLRSDERPVPGSLLLAQRATPQMLQKLSSQQDALRRDFTAAAVRAAHAYGAALSSRGGTASAGARLASGGSGAASAPSAGAPPFAQPANPSSLGRRPDGLIGFMQKPITKRSGQSNLKAPPALVASGMLPTAGALAAEVQRQHLAQAHADAAAAASSVRAAPAMPGAKVAAGSDLQVVCRVPLQVNHAAALMQHLTSAGVRIGGFVVAVRPAGHAPIPPTVTEGPLLLQALASGVLGPFTLVYVQPPTVGDGSQVARTVTVPPGIAQAIIASYAQAPLHPLAAAERAGGAASAGHAGAASAAAVEGNSSAAGDAVASVPVSFIGAPAPSAAVPAAPAAPPTYAQQASKPPTAATSAAAAPAAPAHVAALGAQVADAAAAPPAGESSGLALDAASEAMLHAAASAAASAAVAAGADAAGAQAAALQAMQAVLDRLEAANEPQ